MQRVQVSPGLLDNAFHHAILVRPLVVLRHLFNRPIYIEKFYNPILRLCKRPRSGRVREAVFQLTRKSLGKPGRFKVSNVHRCVNNRAKHISEAVGALKAGNAGEATVKMAEAFYVAAKQGNSVGQLADAAILFRDTQQNCPECLLIQKVTLQDANPSLMRGNREEFFFTFQYPCTSSFPIQQNQRLRYEKFPDYCRYCPLSHRMRPLSGWNRARFLQAHGRGQPL